AGTGNPFFTTDSAAALRAIEINADLLLKATKVDGVYDKDPKKFPDAVRFEELDHNEVIARDLQVMDTAAFALCRDHGIPLRVYDLSVPGNLMAILRGQPIGTLVRARRCARRAIPQALPGPRSRAPFRAARPARCRCRGLARHYPYNRPMRLHQETRR